MGDLPSGNGITWVSLRDLPSGKRLQFAIEAMAIVSIVDLPIFIAWWLFPVRCL